MRSKQPHKESFLDIKEERCCQDSVWIVWLLLSLIYQKLLCLVQDRPSSFQGQTVLLLKWLTLWVSYYSTSCVNSVDTHLGFKYDRLLLQILHNTTYTINSISWEFLCQPLQNTINTGKHFRRFKYEFNILPPESEFTNSEIFA